MKSKYAPYDPAVRAAVEAALIAGEREEAIAAQWDVSVWAIGRWRKELRGAGKMPGRTWKRRVWPQQPDVEAALIAGEESITAIAQRFGVPKRTVSGWRRALVQTGQCAPLSVPLYERQDAPLSVAGTQTTTIHCRRCGAPFPYRHSGPWNPDKLTAPEWLCMPCFDAYCAALAVDEPSAAPGAPEAADEEEDDADAD